jgi:hypothetical protein
LNGLVGGSTLAIAAPHGTTRSPQALRWLLRPRSSLANGRDPVDRVTQVDLLDTPGLNDVEGEVSEQLAWESARRADAILFVIAGDITDFEQQALLELRQLQKPILLVFNKTDLYRDGDLTAIRDQLTGSDLCPLISPAEISFVAARPKPELVRIHSPEGDVNYVWESCPPDVADLKRQLLAIVTRDGQTLVALNVLRQVAEIRNRLVEKKLHLADQKAQTTLWQFVGLKSLAVSVNPFALLDILGSAAADIGLAIVLSRVYGIALTRHGTRSSLKAVWLSWGIFTAVEAISSLMLGWEKATFIGGTILTRGGEMGLSYSTYGMAAIAQASLAGLTAFLVGQALRNSLKTGDDGHSRSFNPAMQSLLQQLEDDSTLSRIRQEIQLTLGFGKSRESKRPE